MLRDTSLDKTTYINGGRNITLNLGDSADTPHTITSTASGVRGFVVNNGSFKVTGYGSVIAEGNSGEAFIVIGNNKADTWSTPVKSELTIGENVKVVSQNDCCVYHYGNGAVTNVYGSLTSNGYYATIQGQGTIDANTNNSGTIVNIYEGASVTCSTREAVYQPQVGETNVFGGTITGATTGIEVRRGTLNISGGTIESTATTFECGTNTSGYSGPTTTGAAVAVAPHGKVNDIGNELKVNITGGRLKGYYGLYQDDPDNRTEQGVAVKMDITGGTFTATGQDGKGIESRNCTKFIRPSDNSESGSPISSTLIDIAFCADGYGPVKTNEGYIVEKLNEKNAAAAVISGDAIKYYASLENAVKEAGSGDTITLLKDKTIEAGDTITVEDNITLEIKDGVTFTNKGVIEVYGELDKSKVTNKENGIVKYHIKGITLENSKIDLIVNKTASVAVVKAPIDAVEDVSGITWSSDNSSVVAVNANGMVTALAKGNATITAKVTINGKELTASCDIAVYGAEQTKAPAAPKMKTNTYTAITLETVADDNVSGAKAQYSKDGGQTWQESPEFKDLLPGTEYVFTVRYGAADNMEYAPSPASNVVKLSTKKGVTVENVKAEDKTELIKEKDELQNALENTSNSYTEGEKLILQNRIVEIDKALAKLNEKIPRNLEILDEKGVVTSADKNYILNSGSKVTIHVSGELSHFIKVTVDDKEVVAANYTLANGSTLLTFANAYLDTLSVGAHTVTMYYTPGVYVKDSVSLILNISKVTAANNTITTDSNQSSGSGSSGSSGSKTANVASVKTGDTNMPVLWLAIGILAAGAAAVLVLNKKKRQDSGNR